MSHNRKYVAIGPYKFRTFKLEDNFGTKSFSTYQETIDYMEKNKALWQENKIDREGYTCRIVVDVRTILQLDGRVINTVPTD